MSDFLRPLSEELPVGQPSEKYVRLYTQQKASRPFQFVLSGQQEF